MSSRRLAAISRTSGVDDRGRGTGLRRNSVKWSTTWQQTDKSRRQTSCSWADRCRHWRHAGTVNSNKHNNYH